MKPEEALIEIEKTIRSLPLNKFRTALEIAREAVKKQVAKKPVIAESAPSYVLGKKVYTEYKACGVCGDVVGGGCAEKSNYCSNCGYKVDWGQKE